MAIRNAVQIATGFFLISCGFFIIFILYLKKRKQDKNKVYFMKWKEIKGK